MKSALKNIDNFFFGHLQEHYAKTLEKECHGMNSLLDIGCGSDSPIKRFSFRLERCVGVDGFQPSLDKSKAQGIHNEYHLMSVLDLDKKFPPKSFDVVIASDLIEHLEKKDGLELIRQMELLARKKVIIFTPNGFLEQREYDGNKYQIHLSGWEVDEMKEIGYTVSGINGWKPLRGEFAKVRYRPRVIFGRISLLSQYLTITNPKLAFAIFCVKNFRTD